MLVVAAKSPLFICIYSNNVAVQGLVTRTSQELISKSPVLCNNFLQFRISNGLILVSDKMNFQIGVILFSCVSAKLVS